MTPRPDGLLGLPTEIFFHIVENPVIGCRDLLNCMLVCRRLRDLLKDSMLWTYQRELERDGLTDGFSTLTTAAKLKKLLDRRQRWKDFEPISVETLSIPFVKGPCCLIGGVFARIVPGPNPGTYSIGVARLPSANGNDHIQDSLPTSKSWRRITALAIDPSQDLLVFLDWDPVTGDSHLNIRTLFAQEPHPLAAKSCIALYDGRGHPYDWDYDMKLGSDLIAIHRYNKTMLRNWKTGITIWEGYYRNTEFFFLSPTLFFGLKEIETNPERMIDLYRVNEPPERADCIAHLMLPPLETSDEGLSFDCADILVELTPLGDHATDNPFLSSPSHGLLLLTYRCRVELTERPGEGGLPITAGVYAVVLRTSGIFRLASEISSSQPDSTQKDIPTYTWNEWAQNELVILESDNDEIGGTAHSAGRIHGSRIIFNDFDWYTEDESGRHFATIYRQSDDVDETPLRRPAPIFIEDERDFTLELESDPAVRRLKVSLKIISAFASSGKCYLDQNHILTLEPDPHEPQNVVPGHGNETGPNRKLVKVWTMG
ncbi:hypothetical protein SISNIDRAFT_484392 [Sistotremastrum niveocremeum HHB9708]|uniref:F-box domain-containing protein n=1 Tax=Sistotremastrum niveocremeum HHB9708 TaxID=1314777 RepID=A0A164W9T8_9AGAM|nr:hypothetical protein SISNIDRAFT_484392 [Sistotremastrum niveocremeum HHB9708]